MLPFILVYLVLFYTVQLNANLKDVDNAIATLIKTAKPWAKGSPKEYTEHVKTLDAEKLRSSERFYPIQLAVPKTDDVECVRREMRAVVVVCRDGYKIFIVPRAVKSWQDLKGIVHLEEYEEREFPTAWYSWFAISRDGDDKYVGTVSWLSTSKEVAADWGYGKGATQQALRMINWLWKTLGIDYANLSDEAIFPCTKKTTFSILFSCLCCKNSKATPTCPLDPAASAGEFGFARVLRLWQGKQDLSIYQKAGYQFEKGSVQQIKKLTKDLREYTMHDFLNDMPEQVKENLEESAIQIPPKGTPGTVGEWLMSVHRDAGCVDYYRIMGQVSDFSKHSTFKRNLKKYIRATEGMELRDIQRQTFDTEYYSAVYQSYGYQRPGSWKMACGTKGKEARVDYVDEFSSRNAVGKYEEEIEELQREVAAVKLLRDRSKVKRMRSHRD
mmetsp:Transcript_49162/g.78530  ORF Transcript_49162/g.78530 Transcript_49162/m.78530 type:complete len:442 (-) Transcript_49162:8-1333(-)